MRRSRRLGFLLLPILSLLGPPALSAQTVVERDVIGSAGIWTEGDGYVLAATLGQPIAGLAQYDAGTAHLGFWHPAQAAASVTGVFDAPRPGAASAALRIACTPNPATTEATVTIDVAAPSDTRVEVFDAAGRGVASLFTEPDFQGESTITFDVSQLPSGVYSILLSTGSGRATTTMIVSQ